MEDDIMRDDEARRHLEDLEKRVARLEKEAQKPPVSFGGSHYPPDKMPATGQFCLCGREVCRAPACPTFQPDPLGR
jgi:hypothetical protein